MEVQAFNPRCEDASWLPQHLRPWKENGVGVGLKLESVEVESTFL